MNLLIVFRFCEKKCLLASHFNFQHLNNYKNGKKISDLKCCFFRNKESEKQFENLEYGKIFILTH